MGYGSIGQHCGTIVIPNSDIYWTTSYHQVRSTQNSGNLGTVTFIISSNDLGVLRIQKSGTSTYFPNCVEVSYYVVGFFIKNIIMLLVKNNIIIYNIHK